MVVEKPSLVNAYINIEATEAKTDPRKIESVLTNVFRVSAVKMNQIMDEIKSGKALVIHDMPYDIALTQTDSLMLLCEKKGIRAHCMIQCNDMIDIDMEET